MAKSCDFARSQDSMKAWMITRKYLDKYNNILDLNSFRKYNTIHTQYAKNKFGVDKGRLYAENDNGTKAIPNQEAFAAIDQSKKSGHLKAYFMVDKNDPVERVSRMLINKLTPRVRPISTNRTPKKVENKISEVLDKNPITFARSTTKDLVQNILGIELDLPSNTDIVTFKEKLKQLLNKEDIQFKVEEAILNMSRWGNIIEGTRKELDQAYKNRELLFSFLRQGTTKDFESRYTEREQDIIKKYAPKIFSENKFKTEKQAFYLYRNILDKKFKTEINKITTNVKMSSVKFKASESKYETILHALEIIPDFSDRVYNKIVSEIDAAMDYRNNPMHTPGRNIHNSLTALSSRYNRFDTLEDISIHHSDKAFLLWLFDQNEPPKVKDALLQISQSSHQLAGFASRLYEKIKDLNDIKVGLYNGNEEKVYGTDLSAYSGVYFYDEDKPEIEHIALNSTSIAFISNPIEIFLHEAMHYATVRVLDSNPNLNKSVSALMNHAAKEIKRLGRYSESSFRFVSPYAFTNEKEFVAEALVNPYFIEVLQNIPAVEPERFRNLFEQFINLILDILGVKTNFYGQVSTIVTKIVEEQVKQNKELDRKIIELRKAKKKGDVTNVVDNKLLTEAHPLKDGVNIQTKIVATEDKDHSRAYFYAVTDDVDHNTITGNDVENGVSNQARRADYISSEELTTQETRILEDKNNPKYEDTINKVAERYAERELVAPGKELVKRVAEIFSSLGYTINEKELLDEFGSLAVVDFANKLIEIAQGSATFADLTEEAIHMFVRLLKVNNDPLYKELEAGITMSDEYNSLGVEYAGYTESQRKEEAIGKVIKNIMLNEEKQAIPEYKGFFGKIKEWFDRLLGRFNSAPYAKAAQRLMNDDLNAYKNKLLKISDSDKLYSKTPTSRESIERSLDVTNNELSKKTFKTSELPSRAYKGSGTEIERYVRKVSGEETVVGGRITDRVDRMHSIGKSDYEREQDKNKPASVMARTMGTRMHGIMEGLNDAITTGQQIEGIKNKSGLSDKHFNLLVRDTKKIVAEFEAIQNKIDPNQKVHFRTEQKILSVHDDEGGTIDLLGVFSDGSVGIVEYKFKQTSIYNSTVDPNTGFRVLTDDVVTPDAAFEYDVQVSRQKKILETEYHVNNVRYSRVVPYAISVPYDKATKQYKNTIVDIFSPFDSYQGKLEPIVVAGESTGIEALDKSLTHMYKLLETLRGKRSEPNIKREDKERYGEMIKRVTKGIQQAQKTYDISLLLFNAYSITKPLVGEVGKTEGKLASANDPVIDGKPNPNYMTYDELREIKDQIDMYLGLLKDNYQYLLGVASELNDTQIENLKRRIATTKVLLDNTLSIVNDKLSSRLMDTSSGFNVDMNRPIMQRSWLMKLMDTFSEVDHPAFETAHHLIATAEQYRRAKVLQVAEELEPLLKELFKYADSVGINHVEIFNKFISQNGFRIKGKYKSELFDVHLANARANGNVDWIKTHFKVSPTYDYQLARKNAIAQYEDTYRDREIEEGNIVNLSHLRRQKLEEWELRNDPQNDGFWLNKNNQYRMELRPEYESQFVSDEYKEIAASPALKNFYDYMIAKNKEFLDIIGEDKFGTLFLPKVRKSGVDDIAQHTNSFKEFGQHLLDSMQIKQDGIMGQYDPNTGELRNNVPLLYLNPFRDNAGNIDISQNSRDLGRNLLLFAESVYNYASKKDIEGVILALGDWTAMNVNGELKKSKKGENEEDIKSGVRKIYDKSTYADEFKKVVINYYLYGQKIQNDKSFRLFGRDLSVNRSVKAIMSYHRMKTLGLAAIPPLAARFAGEGGIYFEGVKGRFYNVSNMKKAHRYFWENKKEYHMLVKYFNIYQEEQSFRLAHNLSASQLSKHLTLDQMVRGYSLADEKIDNTVTLAMCDSHTINEDGNVVRMTDEMKKNGAKSILERMHVVNDKIVIDGMTDENYRGFRQKMRSVTGSIKGQMSAEDINAVNTMLVGQMAMMYRNWMPKVIKERLGKFRYNPALQGFEEGRYRVMMTQMFNEQYTFSQTLKNIGTFGLNMINILGGIRDYNRIADHNDPKYQAARRVLENDYRKFQRRYHGDSRFGENFTLDDFIQLRIGQMKAFTAEARVIMIFLSAMVAGKMDWDDDGEAEWKDIWLTRKLFQTLNRTQGEWAFIWNPTEWKNFFSSPFALTGMFNDVLNVAGNTMDEMRDYFFGENANNDRTPWFYYSSKFIPGIKQLQSITEWYKQDEQKTR